MRAVALFVIAAFAVEVRLKPDATRAIPVRLKPDPTGAIPVRLKPDPTRADVVSGLSRTSEAVPGFSRTSEVANFDAALAVAKDLPRLHSLLISRRGELVLERYYNDARATRPANIKSASKSLISALVGIAIDRRLIIEPVGATN
jgi:CubicO group peptidase (beta-lactamase class C family)